MTAGKRVGLTGLALICCGALAVYFAMSAAPNGASVGPAIRMAALIVSILAAVVTLVLWRNFHRTVRTLSAQLKSMAQADEMIPIGVDYACDKLLQIARPLNDVLTRAKKRIDGATGKARELQIQLRVADAQKHHTEAIIYSISDAVVVTNKFDELIMANEAAEKLLGFRHAEGVRRGIEEVISDGTFVRLVRETRAHGRTMTRKVVEHTIDQNGPPRTFNITLSCVVAPNDEVSGVVAVLHDVTREKEIARMKTDFVSNVSHELKTPLASIKAYVEMLLDGEAEDKDVQREFYETISSETDRLHRLIENILNISRIESGVVKVVREPVSLTVVVKQAIGVASPQAKAKNIELAENLAPIYYQVEADRDMVYQAVLNLLSNAIKYTPESGGVSVNVSVDESRGIATLSVMDTGNGIPSEDLPRIFDKFYRVQANNSMAKGTGLGLALVKHIIEVIHDGRLVVDSEVGVGSTFSFELPLLT